MGMHHHIDRCACFLITLLFIINVYRQFTYQIEADYLDYRMVPSVIGCILHVLIITLAYICSDYFLITLWTPALVPAKEHSMAHKCAIPIRE